MKTTDTIETKTVSKAIANKVAEHQTRSPVVETIQPKLNICQPNDKYEKDADEVASTVMNTTEPASPSTITQISHDLLQFKPIANSITPWIQKQEIKEEQPIQEKHEEQAKPFLPAVTENDQIQTTPLPFTPNLTSKTSLHTTATSIQRQEEEEEGQLQPKIQTQLKEEEAVQASVQLKTQPESTTSITHAKAANATKQNTNQLGFTRVINNYSITNSVSNEIVQAKTVSVIPNRNRGSPLIRRNIQGHRIRDSSNVSSSNLISADQKLRSNIRDGPIVARSGGQSGQRAPPVNGQGDSTVEQTLQSSNGGGMSISDNTRTFMESRFGHDFSGVRIHTGTQAVEMSKSLNAQAFTHGNNIYFNQGKYSLESSSGKHLLAHELTHTIQQGASTKSISSKTEIQSIQPKLKASTGGKRIQRGWLGDAWDSVSGAVSGAVEWAADQLSAGIDWIKRQARDFIANIPGYRLFTVVIGYDPISGESVDRNGRNFIEAGIDIIPGGASFKQKLEEEGAIAEAATWLDGEIAKLNLNPSAIGSQISRFFSSLSITDIASPGNVLSRLSGIIRAPVQRVIRFAINVATKLLEIVKSYVINSLITFIREQTNAYPLLTVILGQDPVSGEEVERTPIALLRGFMQLSDSGQEQLRQMEESGSLERAAAWLDGAITRLNITPEIIRESFRRAWNLVSIESLLNPIDAFQALYNIFAAPVGRIIRFLIEIAIKVLQLIKDALIQRLVEYARSTRGYLLLTVILGKDPFSGQIVERTTENIIHGFMAFKEGGEEQFQEMQQSGAIARMAARVEAAVASLNFTWEYIRGLFVTAWESLSLADLANPFAAFARILGIFADPLMRLIAFVWEIIKIVIEVLLTMMNFPFDLINSIIARTLAAIDDIKRDPIGFLKNIMRAVKSGFMQFIENIGTHLLNGLVDWLFGELDEAGISPPTDLSFGSILGLVFQVLGITIDRIWAKLADRIGQERVDRIRGMIDRLTGIWTFVRDVMQRGVVAIWEYIQGQLSNLWNMVLESIRNWIVTRIIQQVTARLLSMLDPTGIMAVINGFIAFFNAVQSFIRYIREMLEIVNSVVSGIAEIASGSIATAANFLENSLARAVPIAIGFLANQVGLGSLGHRIGEMIERVRAMVDRALDWLVDRAVSAGTSFLNLLRGGGSDTETQADDTPEGRKQQAATEVHQAISRGIRRTQLISLLNVLRARYRLIRAELDSNDDVILVNSPPLRIRGRAITVQGPVTSNTRNTEQSNENQPSQITIGAFRSSAENVQTIRGVLSPHMSPSSWPVSSLPQTAARPRQIHAEIYGAVGDGLTLNPRNSDNTRIVGHFGNWESGLRRNNQSWRQGQYDGGHILGHQFGGNESYDNLVPQVGNALNRGMYARMESFVRSNLTNQDSNQITTIHQPELEINATLNYPSNVSARRVEQTAKILAGAYLGDNNQRSNFLGSIPDANKDMMISVPARVPTSMSVQVTLQADRPTQPLDINNHASNQVNVTSQVSENDPIIITESNQAHQSNFQNIGQSGNGQNSVPRQRWNATFEFTQSIRA